MTGGKSLSAAGAVAGMDASRGPAHAPAVAFGARGPPSAAATLQALTAQVTAFRDARDWAQFHRPKDVALGLSLEAAEVLELFQWKEGAEAQAVYASQKLEDELSDVLYWVLLMAHDAGFDLAKALEAKLAKNAIKYPVEKARGTSRKYTEL